MNCTQCPARATQTFAWIEGTTKGKPYGSKRKAVFCDACATEIATTTQRRYIVTPIGPRPRVDKSNPGQIAWPM